MSAKSNGQLLADHSPTSQELDEIEKRLNSIGQSNPNSPPNTRLVMDSTENPSAPMAKTSLYDHDELDNLALYDESQDVAPIDHDHHGVNHHDDNLPVSV